MQLGLTTLHDSGWSQLRRDVAGRVATLVHAASVLPDSLEHVVDALHRAQDVDLVAVYAPEHGFRGDHQAEHGDVPEHVDPGTGVDVFSVYRRNATALVNIMERTRAQTVLVDMQDAGTRLYTFVWTLFDLLEAVTRMRPSRRPAFVVTDRPNPLGGLRVEGPALNASCCASRYGRLAGVTHVHGMTIGELARYFVDALGADAPKLTVVPMQGWRRSMSYFDVPATLPWLPPSPNLPTPDAAMAYPVTVWLEATPNVTEGRGTSLPFSLIGAPSLNGSMLASRLNARAGGCSSGNRCGLNLWREMLFVPTWWKFVGQNCGGVQLVRPPTRGRLFGKAIDLLVALRDQQPGHRINWDGAWFGQPGSLLFDRYAGTTRLRELLDDPSLTSTAIQKAFEAEAAAFENARRPFLLYE